ncbi:hypothetical protein BDQ94DRAFT_136666 [Aspergillus welwitschiae]|uniref:Uncharacterized protein n=1 Tax=Aspergillus welwitschiae TaxID=1341132 RepID=A0A3F3QEB7_9EURO|nr:hypothetical protein BDQ94DRAFT_136666 [Aspergillus welwitschiae]RDH37573.1 hypothetical protein BDQ94DRAFT_136666 [Aspergillus welwitschiae]
MLTKLESSKCKGHLGYSVNCSMASIGNGLPFSQRLGRIGSHLPAGCSSVPQCQNTNQNLWSGHC